MKLLIDGAILAACHHLVRCKMLLLLLLVLVLLARSRTYQALGAGARVDLTARDISDDSIVAC